MKINGKQWRTIWLQSNGDSIGVIDQRKLPHNLTTQIISTYEETADAIKNMVVRGAPLIGVTAAYGLMLALQKDPSNQSLDKAYSKLLSARPTAINLQWALRRVRNIVKDLPREQRAKAAQKEAQALRGSE